jgi:hypothetical protein
MKFDFDLIRAILLKVEDVPANHMAGTITVPDYDEDTTLEHLALLYEAGLIHAVVGKLDNRKKRIHTVHVERLTWEGHQFLADARNEEIWSRTKAAVAQKGGSVSFEIFKTLLTQIAMKFVIG